MGEVPFAHLLHAHVLIESKCRILSVHIQFHAARFWMKFLDTLYSLLEQLPSEFVFLEVGEYVIFCK